jgi:cobalt-zinc-cadmium efflux system protein
VTVHEHTHHDETAGTRPLSIAMALVVLVLVVEVAGAVVSGSLALLADAGHMLSDLAGLIIAFLAMRIAARPATDRQTFGYRRAEVFGALINGTILLVIAALVVIGALGRIVNAHHDVEALPMLVAAAVGLVANTVALWVLRPAAQRSINMRGAYLEVFGDLLGAFAVLAASVVIMTTGFDLADPLASLLIAALIVPRAVSLLREVLRVLVEAAPADADVAAIRRHLEDNEGVLDVHDVHIWAITAGVPVFTAHVVVSPQVFLDGRAGPLLDALTRCLSAHFDVSHATFQLEPAGHGRHESGMHR